MPKKVIPESIMTGDHLLVINITLNVYGELHFQSWMDTTAPEFAQVLGQVIPQLVEAAVEETAAVCQHPLAYLEPLTARIVKEG